MRPVRGLGALAALSVVALVASLTTVGTAVAAPSAPTGATALAAPAYDRNFVMDNSVFENTSTMTAAQIQAFLDGFPSSCLRSYRSPDPLAYSSYGGDVSAATVIKHASSLWGVNPQVLLVTLEKEQTLVSGGSGCAPWRYWSAMGYNCPDGGAQYAYPDLGITSTCVQKQSNAGFSAQVNHGAWQLMFNRQRADGNVNWNNSGTIPNYGFYTAGMRQQMVGAPLKEYTGYYAIDGQTVYMGNGTTATLYTYTPHLSANQTFYTLFTRWFGSATQPSVDWPPYVGGVYRVLLQRPVDSSGLNYWSSFLAGGGSPATFVSAIVHGTEYTRLTVGLDYLQMLKRAGDSGGVSYWAERLAITGRNDLILANLAGSDEYFAVRSRSDVPTFVSNLYQDLFQRSIDPGGLAYWTDQIRSGRMSRYSVALTLQSTSEYALRLVNAAYNFILGRDADSTGARWWADRYMVTHDILELVVSLAASDEGRAHLSAILP